MSDDVVTHLPPDLLELEHRFAQAPTLALLLELQAAHVEHGLCACRCRTRLESTKRKRRHRDDRHRERAYRERVETAASEQGVKTRLSLEDLDTANRSGTRHADAPAGPSTPQRRRRAPRPGVSLYLPDPALLETVHGILVAHRLITDEGEPDASLDAAIAAAQKARDRLERRRAR